MENNDTNKNGVIGVPEGIGGLPPATPATAGDPAKKIEHLTHLMYAIVVVLFIGFAGMFVQSAAMLWNAWHTESSSYQNLQDEVQAQNTKIDDLSNELKLRRNLDEMSHSTSTKP